MAAVQGGKCSDYSAVDDGRSSGTSSEVSGGKGFMLFGVRVMMEGSFRKSASMNNLAQYDQQPQDSNNDVASGYASDDVVHPSGRSRERKRGVPWSEEEHRLFLLGLQKVVGSAIEDQMHQENSPQPPITQQQNLSKNLEKFPMSTFPVAITPLVVPITSETHIENRTLGQVNQLNNSPRPIRPIPILPVPPSSKMANLNLNKTTSLQPPSLSLNLSISSQSPPPLPPSNQEPLPPPPPPPQSNQQSPPARHTSTFQAMPASFNESGGDSIISVA
ncbi:UNVERIFIED_CONTAM: Transcription factor R1 [Sesamum angustifolium]|uniref:Transcription factor R1 n=1 Tax=Sesamum angustifolium TaxID=2727405 RepID=A0AAW2Q8C8_9LAMI